MAKPFKELRYLMHMDEIDQATLGRLLGRSPFYISDRMRGLQPWNMQEVYILCDYFSIAHKEISKYFPPHDYKKKKYESKDAAEKGQRGRRVS